MKSVVKESKTFLNMHKRLETAIVDYDMVGEGDHVVVGLSGGKDSTLLLRLMARDKIRLSCNFKLSAVYVRQGFGNDEDKLAFLTKLCQELDVPFHTIETPVEKTIEERKESPCYICSRMRRIAIFEVARSVGANKVAFGHHRDDFIETFMMNIYFNHEIATMKPNNPFFGGKFFLIRPMLYIDEKDILKESVDIPTFLSGCPYETVTERGYVKSVLDELYKKNPKIKQNVFRAMFTPNVEYLLKEPSLKGMLK